MTNSEFFDWLRSMQDDKKLTQNEVDTANALLSNTDAQTLKNWLMDINNWSDTSGMTLSQKGLDIIKQFEGFRSAPYRDSVGVWTIGYGPLTIQVVKRYQQVISILQKVKPVN